VKKAANTSSKKPVKKAAKKTSKKSSKKVVKKAAKTTAKRRVAKAPRKTAKAAAPKRAVKIKKKATKVKSSAAKKVVARKVAKPLRKVVAKKAVKFSLKPAIRLDPKPIHLNHPPLVSAVLTQLEDSKAEQIVTIDLANRSTMADMMIVASGRSNRHVSAISDQVVEMLEKNGKKNLRIEGKPQCDWVLVDAGDVIIHIFRPEVRSFYNLEKLWSAHAPGDAGSR
jgi:ribosome-associated protein